MATFAIRTINRSFSYTTEVSNLPDLDAAVAIGVRTAVAIATEEIQHGEITAAVSLEVADPEKTVVRKVVAITVASLAPD